jgi:hypothetical protein
MPPVTSTSRQRHVPDDDLLITMSDSRGLITYANDAFCQTHACHEHDLLRQPHKILRHPDMPAAIFALVWQRLKAGEEIFAYVKNLAMNGDYYWTLAHWRVNADRIGRVAGYQCCRRATSARAVSVIEPLYRDLRNAERALPANDAGSDKRKTPLDRLLADRHQTYDQFVLSLVMEDEMAA